MNRIAVLVLLSVGSLMAGSYAAQDAASAPTAPVAQAPQFAPGEVGIDEKLGATIPLDLVLKDEEGKPVTPRAPSSTSPPS